MFFSPANKRNTRVREVKTLNILNILNIPNILTFSNFSCITACSHYLNIKKWFIRHLITCERSRLTTPQPSNTSEPIFVTLAGMVTVVSLAQSRNVSLGSSLRFSGNLTFVRLVHPKNISSLTAPTYSGSSMLCSAVQRWKQPDSSSRRSPSKTTFLRFLQFAKTEPLMIFTEAGITISLMPDPMNARKGTGLQIYANSG